LDTFWRFYAKGGEIVKKLESKEGKHVEGGRDGEGPSKGEYDLVGVG
jgi:hypothetical protein